MGAPHQEAAITVMLDAAVEALLIRGWDVGVDATHLQPGTLEHWVGLAERLGIRHEVLDLTGVPTDECVLRDLARRAAGGWYVGEQVIRKMASRYVTRLGDPLA